MISFPGCWLAVTSKYHFYAGNGAQVLPAGPGGLLALEAVLIGMATPEAVYEEVTHNLPVILLLTFMVAGVFFLQELLLFLFTR